MTQRIRTFWRAMRKAPEEGMTTAEYAVGHHTARLTEIEHTYGDTRYHLSRLARGVSEYGGLDLVS